MAAFVSILREGDFLTRERIRLWTIAILLGFAAGLLVLAFTAHGLSDYQGRPLGTDFSSFYSAARLTLAGHTPYDQAALYRMQQEIFGRNTTYYAFAYPPIFLSMVLPLARLPYLLALALWQGIGLTVYLCGLARLRRTFAPALADDRLFWLLALGFTATFVNLTHGQTGFLSAGLLALALSLLEEAPLSAGVCFGLMAFKPQLGLLIPFALIASGNWRSFLAATVTVIFLVALSTVEFGLGAWRDFLAASAFSEDAILHHGAVGYEKMVSIFAWMRLWGFSVSFAYGAQIAVSFGVLVGIVWLWHSNRDLKLKAAALCLGTLLVTPFALDYDMMVLAPAIVLLASDGIANGFRPYERALLAVLWFVPIMARGFTEHTHVPLGVLVMLVAFGSVIRHGLSRSHTQPTLAAA